jgi:hypothetical protein
MTRKIIKYSFGFFFLFYMSVDIYIYFCYTGGRTAKALVWATSIYSAIPDDSIPDNIINAYGKVFPNSMTNKIYPDLLWCLFTLRHNNSYVQVNFAYDITTATRLKLISVANQIDNRLTKKQCIYGYLCEFDYWSNLRGINRAAKTYYHKDLKGLSETECLELVIMTKNPALFDKSRHQDKLDQEVNKVL